MPPRLALARAGSSGLASWQGILGVQRPGDARNRRPAKKGGNVAACHAQARHVDPGFDAEAREQIEHVLARDVAGRTLGIRAPAQSRDGTVESRYAEFQRRV